MNTVAIFEALAATCAFIAVVFLVDQQIHRPRPYNLMWSVGLASYSIAAAAAAVGSAGGWTVAEYKLWYFFGGLLTAAYLGLGSYYLLGSRRVARVLAVGASLLALYGAVRILFYTIPVPLAARIAGGTTAQVTDVKHLSVMPGDLTFLALIMNIPGALLLFGGAVSSAWMFYRRQAPGYRVFSMALLALGALFPTMLTGLQRLGYSGGAALGEFLGALCLLAGLLISLEVFIVFRVPFTTIVLRDRTARPLSDLPLSERS